MGFRRLVTSQSFKSDLDTVVGRRRDGWKSRHAYVLMIVSLGVVLELRVSDAQRVAKNHKGVLQSIVIPHIKYGQGLNRWSFLSVDRENHGLHSDLLCPNPLLTSVLSSTWGNSMTGTRVRSQQAYTPQQQSRFPGGQTGPASSQHHHQQSLPNEIWALKTDGHMNLLPCSLRQYAVPPPVGAGNAGITVMSGGGGHGRSNTRHNNGHFIENRILFINVSLVPFNFHGAEHCSKYIKLMYDDEEGTTLRCGDIQFDPRHDTNNKYHVNWPANPSTRKEYFSLLDNLERFLIKEQTLHKQFYFQIYFTSQVNGRSKRCTVQQYELDLSYPAGNARFCNLSSATGGGHEELCGEFHCEDLIFPLYSDPDVHSKDHQKGREEEEHYEYGYEEEEEEEDDEGSHEVHGATHHRERSSVVGETRDGDDKQQENGGFSWTRMIRMDMRLLIFFTVVPLVLFGVLVFGLELIVYFMCCRKRREEECEGGTRSQQLLENSLNVWENVPSRLDAQRTVSFSPMTTSIYGDRKNQHLQMMDATSLDSHPDTPKILKSALKAAKPGDHGSPTGHHYFDYHDHDMPPSYIETTTR